MKAQEILWYCWVQIWHWKRVLGMRNGEEEGQKACFPFLPAMREAHEKLKPKDLHQVLGIHQTVRGMEQILARSSWCLCTRMTAMRGDRDRQQTKLENKPSSQYVCTDHATALTVSPPSLTPSQHGKHRKGHEGDESQKTRTKKRRERAACLSQQNPAFLFSVCFSYLNVQSLRPVD